MLCHNMRGNVWLVTDYQRKMTPPSPQHPQGWWVCQPIHTHTNPLRKIKWSSAITRLTAHFVCGLMSDLVICKRWKGYGHTWHQIPLLKPGVVKQHKTQTPLPRQIWLQDFKLLRWLLSTRLLLEMLLVQNSTNDFTVGQVKHYVFLSGIFFVQSVELTGISGL